MATMQSRDNDAMASRFKGVVGQGFERLVFAAGAAEPPAPASFFAGSSRSICGRSCIPACSCAATPAPPEAADVTERESERASSNVGAWDERSCPS